MRLLFSTNFLALFFLATASGAQEWPTIGEVIDDGEPIGTPVLSQLLEENATVLSFSLGAATFGQIVECAGEQSQSIFFDSGFSHFEIVECRQTEHGLCIEDECYSFFSHPGWDVWFVEFDLSNWHDLSAEEIAKRRALADCLGINRIRLSTLHVGLYVSRRHEAHIMAEGP